MLFLFDHVTSINNAPVATAYVCDQIFMTPSLFHVSKHFYCIFLLALRMCALAEVCVRCVLELLMAWNSEASTHAIHTHAHTFTLTLVELTVFFSSFHAATIPTNKSHLVPFPPFSPMYLCRIFHY